MLSFSVDACIKKKLPLSSRLINDVFMDLSHASPSYKQKLNLSYSSLFSVLLRISNLQMMRCGRISIQNAQAKQQDSSPTASAWSNGRGCRSMLSYHDPTAAGRETTPATVGRSVVLNDKYSQLSQSRKIGSDSLWRATSSKHRRRWRCRSCTRRKLDWLG